MEKNTKSTFKKSRININSWKFISIPIVLILVFSFYPMIQAFILSFQSGKGTFTEFNGIKNYIRLFTDPIFIQSVKNTFTYLIVQVPIMLVLGLIIASMLNSSHIKFKGFFRTAIFLPCITSLVAYSVLFKSLFSVDGIINNFLMAINILNEPIAWILHPIWAKVVIIIAITWRWTGYNMMFYLAAMQNVDKSIYEAAKIDGATGIQQFFRITVPILKPIILFTAITSTNGTVQLFDEVMNITAGGPGNATMTISQYIYNLSFVYTPNFGYAATVSYAIVFIVAIMAIIQLKVAGDSNE